MSARFAILGNSGSGKSTLAAALARYHSAPALDLDTVAWVPNTVGVRRGAAEAAAGVRRFCAGRDSFVVEGCYDELIAVSCEFDPHLVFLDVDGQLCEQHCLSRPFEGHKYQSRQAQDAQLALLLDWVRGYYARSGPMSRASHLALFESYPGPKSRFRSEVRVSGRGEILEGA